MQNETQKREQKEILFIKNDLIALNRSKNNYSEIISIYKNRLVELDAMKQIKNKPHTIKNCKYKGKIRNVLQTL